MMQNWDLEACLWCRDASGKDTPSKLTQTMPPAED